MIFYMVFHKWDVEVLFQFHKDGFFWGTLLELTSGSLKFTEIWNHRLLSFVFVSILLKNNTDFFCMCWTGARCTQTWATQSRQAQRPLWWEWHQWRPSSRVLRWVLVLRMVAASVAITAPAIPAPASEEVGSDRLFEAEIWSLPTISDTNNISNNNNYYM